MGIFHQNHHEKENLLNTFISFLLCAFSTYIICLSSLKSMLSFDKTFMVFFFFVIIIIIKKPEKEFYSVFALVLSFFFLILVLSVDLQEWAISSFLPEFCFFFFLAFSGLKILHFHQFHGGTAPLTPCNIHIISTLQVFFHSLCAFL